MIHGFVFYCLPLILHLAIHTYTLIYICPCLYSYKLPLRSFSLFQLNAINHLGSYFAFNSTTIPIFFSDTEVPYFSLHLLIS